MYFLFIIFHSHSLFRLEFSTPTPRQKCNFGTLSNSLSITKEDLDGLLDRTLHLPGPFTQGPQVVWGGHWPVCPHLCAPLTFSNG